MLSLLHQERSCLTWKFASVRTNSNASAPSAKKPSERQPPSLDQLATTRFAMFFCLVCCASSTCSIRFCELARCYVCGFCLCRLSSSRAPCTPVRSLPPVLISIVLLAFAACAMCCVPYAAYLLVDGGGDAFVSEYL